MTDLRFCGIQTARFLAELAEKWNASLVIAHTSVSGLPKIELEEAESIFNEAVCPNINYRYLLLNMLDKNNQENTLEVMVGQMKADLLVLVNQHFHFNTIIKQYFKDNCARYKPAPLLIFPS
ncbi:hypothetical protein ABIB40_001912 [Pedobacter sp. UYP30]|uniref:hypothetical protein n=1 Tax=Pedobacter sp. UYP30 TaxID=1756400 RepID=UPI003391D889